MARIVAVLLLALACQPKAGRPDPSVAQSDDASADALRDARRACRRAPTASCAHDWAVAAQEAIASGALARGAVSEQQIEEALGALVALGTPEALLDAARLYQSLGRTTEAVGAARAGLLLRRDPEALALYVAVEPDPRLRRAECRATYTALPAGEARREVLTACARAGDDLGWASPADREQLRAPVDEAARAPGSTGPSVVRVTLRNTCPRPVSLRLGPGATAEVLTLGVGSPRSYALPVGLQVWLLDGRSVPTSSFTVGEAPTRVTVAEDCTSVVLR